MHRQAKSLLISISGFGILLYSIINTSIDTHTTEKLELLSIQVSLVERNINTSPWVFLVCVSNHQCVLQVQSMVLSSQHKEGLELHSLLTSTHLQVCVCVCSTFVFVQACLCILDVCVCVCITVYVCI